MMGIIDWSEGDLHHDQPHRPPPPSPSSYQSPPCHHHHSPGAAGPSPIKTPTSAMECPELSSRNPTSNNPSSTVIPELNARVEPSTQTLLDARDRHELHDSPAVENMPSTEGSADQPLRSAPKKARKRNRSPPPGGHRCPFSIPREGYLPCPKPSAQTRQTVLALHDLR